MIHSNHQRALGKSSPTHPPLLTHTHQKSASVYKTNTVWARCLDLVKKIERERRERLCVCWRWCSCGPLRPKVGWYTGTLVVEEARYPLHCEVLGVLWLERCYRNTVIHPFTVAVAVHLPLWLATGLETNLPFGIMPTSESVQTQKDLLF